MSCGIFWKKTARIPSSIFERCEAIRCLREIAPKAAAAIKKASDGCLKIWSRGPDLNRRPPGYEPGELPDCSTPHYVSPKGQKEILLRLHADRNAFAFFIARRHDFFINILAAILHRQVERPCDLQPKPGKNPAETRADQICGRVLRPLPPLWTPAFASTTDRMGPGVPNRKNTPACRFSHT